MLEEFKENIKDIHIPFYNKKALQKLSIKKGIYYCLSNFFKKELPWGILTGIRPVKIVHNLINNKLTSKRILEILEREYQFESSKAQLILKIALFQRKYIYPIKEDKFSLYINIPFCPSKCSYCSFPSYDVKKNEDRVEKYVDTLLLEIRSSKEIFKNKKINTIYIGGGTPTSLNKLQLERILIEIKNIVPEDIREFTVEAGRPDTINEEKLKLLKKHGVNRISINPQSFNPNTLKTIGRNHEVESVKSSYNLAKSLDFDIINMDIILGLPGESLKELENTLREIKLLNPENLTVHTLSLKRGSKLQKNPSENIDKQINIERMLKRTLEYSKDENYLPYYLYRQKQILGNLENIGYAKKSKECIYNISMMEEKETIIGFGLGAVTKVYYPREDKIKRIANFKSLYDYTGRISELIEKKKNINFQIY